MDLTQDNKCWKYNNEVATILHAWWNRPLVLSFWKEVLKKLKEWLKHPLPETPQMCLLGDTSLMLTRTY